MTYYYPTLRYVVRPDHAEGPNLTIAVTTRLRGERPFITRLAILAGTLPLVRVPGGYRVRVLDALAPVPPSRGVRRAHR